MDKPNRKAIYEEEKYEADKEDDFDSDDEVDEDIEDIDEDDLEYEIDWDALDEGE